MELPRRVAGALGLVVVAGLVPDSCRQSLGRRQGRRCRRRPGPASGPADACVSEGGTGAVRAPRFVRQIATGETGWFSSPGLVDLDGDGRLEIVAPFYSTFVFDAKGRQLGRGTASEGRVYPPSVVTDLEGDGVTDIVVAGNEGTVAAYEFRGGTLHVKAGWPASTNSGGQSPEARGLAAADLDGDGTRRGRGDDDQHLAHGRAGVRLRRERRPVPAGRAATPPPGPATTSSRGRATTCRFNQVGNHGYGAYGENVAIGNIDDDSDLEIITTFDNHQINAFNLDGTSILASPWFTNRESDAEGRRMGWGQFIRWADPGSSGATTTCTPALAEPGGPDLAAVDRVAARGGRPRRRRPQRGRRAPQRRAAHPLPHGAHAFMVLDGAYGDGSRSARRHRGFEKLPMSNHPVHRPDGDWYPPSGIPAPTVVDIVGDDRPEIVAALPGGKVYAVGPDGDRLWTADYAPRRAKTFASEVVAADLNKDGRPELVFGTYALRRNAGRLVVLSAKGKKLSVTRLRHQGQDGNGIGVAAAPSIGDLTGNGTLEIVLTTFDHGVDVYTVPGSGTGCLPWPTGRGNVLRNGTGPATAP